MARASPTAASTGKPRLRRWIFSPMPSKQDGAWPAALSANARHRKNVLEQNDRPESAQTSRADSGRTSCLAAAADALDLLVEDGVFLAQHIVRIVDVLLVV